jgi:hypothetical protein
MNELRAQPDILPWNESGVIRNSYKIRDLTFWQANCIQWLSKTEMLKKTSKRDLMAGWRPAVRERVQFRAVSDSV